MKINSKKQGMVVSFAGLLGICLLLFTACKKQFNSDVNRDSLIEDAKIWFSNDVIKKEKESLKSLPGTVAKSSAVRMFARMEKLNEIVNWKQAREYKHNGLSYVLAPIDQAIRPFKNQDFESGRSLIFYKDKMGEMQMNVVEILSKKGSTLRASIQEISQAAFANKYFGQNNNLKNVNASIMFYDAHYAYENSFQVTNGTWAKAKISLQNEKNAIERQAVTTMAQRIGEEGCETYYLVGFWYDTYTGDVESYEILDEWQVCPESAPPPYGYGSYEAGSHYVPDENCNSKAEELQGNAVSEQTSVITVGEDAILKTRTKTYHWVIFKQKWGLWKFTSHEKGVHQKTTSTTNPWKWKSLTHESISKEGVWTGGTVSCSLNSEDPYIALYNAGIELNYTIQADAICKGFPIGAGGTFTSSAIWNISQ